MEAEDRRLTRRVAAELRAEMARQGISRRWLAEQVGESHVTVSRWVRGDTCPTLEALDAMCAVLGITIPELFGAVVRNGGYDRPDPHIPRPRTSAVTRHHVFAAAV